MFFTITAKAPEAVTVTVNPTRSQRGSLKKRGGLRVKPAVKFTPSNGAGAADCDHGRRFDWLRRAARPCCRSTLPES